MRKNTCTRTSLTGLACLAALLLILAWPRSEPRHQGVPVSAWFRDLCSGVFSGTPRGDHFPEAYAAFTNMNTNVIPYLVNQLRYDRSGIQQQLWEFLKRVPLARAFARNVVLPNDRRNYAAVALRQMGAKAEAAVPALMETWAHDLPDVKVNAISAMESILLGNVSNGATAVEWRRLENQVLIEAARRYPQTAAELKLIPGRNQ